MSSVENLETDANTVKNLLLYHLFQNEYISESVYNDLLKNHAIILKKKSFFLYESG